MDVDVSAGSDTELMFHDGTVRDLMFMQDTSNRSSVLISGGAGNCKIFVTDCETGTPIRTMTGHTGTSRSCHTSQACTCRMTWLFSVVPSHIVVFIRGMKWLFSVGSSRVVGFYMEDDMALFSGVITHCSFYTGDDMALFSGVITHCSVYTGMTWLFSVGSSHVIVFIWGMTWLFSVVSSYIVVFIRE